jgi:hypothetical protein
LLQSLNLCIFVAFWNIYGSCAILQVTVCQSFTTKTQVCHHNSLSVLYSAAYMIFVFPLMIHFHLSCVTEVCVRSDQPHLTILIIMPCRNYHLVGKFEGNKPLGRPRRHFSAASYATASHILSVHFFFLSSNLYGKWLGHATNLSPPSSSKVYNAWRCTCVPF